MVSCAVQEAWFGKGCKAAAETSEAISWSIVTPTFRFPTTNSQDSASQSATAHTSLSAHFPPSRLVPFSFQYSLLITAGVVKRIRGSCAQQACTRPSLRLLGESIHERESSLASSATEMCKYGLLCAFEEVAHWLLDENKQRMAAWSCMSSERIREGCNCTVLEKYEVLNFHQMPPPGLKTNDNFD